jgi:predicted unusual protein kinase regulating ubiquinone biosynthesis (AarF/ABC1/UbiB family)
MEPNQPSTQESIATGKVQRSMKILSTGVRVGANYVKHYAGKAIGQPIDKENLDKANAQTIFQSLNELKGSALKVAQMLSMDKGILPEAYRTAFAQAQNRAQPLSAPLIINAFKKSFGKSPFDMFDHFELQASHAASIGQVHRAEWQGKQLAVKIQYPGVAESIQSDLRLVKPFALRLLGMQEMELERYFEEVEAKLMEETNYALEWQRGQEIGSACAHLPGMVFPTYYPEWSSERILVMDWIEGIPLSTFLETHRDGQSGQIIGQRLWDFYAYQLHELKRLHADPHPGNFLVTKDGQLGVLDFGCIKEIPESFYHAFFGLVHHKGPADETFLEHMRRLELILPGDSVALQNTLVQLYEELISLFGRPYRESPFDFSQADFMTTLYQKGESLTQIPELREARGVKDFIYVNRTHFGLYHLLHSLGGKIKTEYSALTPQ